MPHLAVGGQEEQGVERVLPRERGRVDARQVGLVAARGRLRIAAPLVRARQLVQRNAYLGCAPRHTSKIIFKRLSTNGFLSWCASKCLLKRCQMRPTHACTSNLTRHHAG